MITVYGCLWGREIRVRLGREAKDFFFSFYSGNLFEFFLYKCIYILFKLCFYIV